MDPLKRSVYNILADHFSVSAEDISDGIGPGDLVNWDSLGQMQLVIKIEKEFNFKFTVEEIIAINSVKDLMAVIKRHSSNREIEDPIIDQRQNKSIVTHLLRLPRNTYWGENSIRALNMLEQKKVVIVLGSSAYTSGMKQKLSMYLRKSKIDFVQKENGEPQASDIYKAAEALSKHSPDLIIAAGGGSCLDTAKLSWVLYEYPGLKLGDLACPHSLPPLRNKASFIAIPTTFGSGSEVSSAAVFSKDDSMAKTVIVSHELLPDQVILDPNLGESMPLGILYTSAFDALTHAIEGFVSSIVNPAVDPYAIFSVKNIINALHEIQQKGISSRHLYSLCYSAYYSGIVQNHCSAGLTHSLAHQLGNYGIRHGLGNALFLTIVIECNKRWTDRYDQLADGCGFGRADGLITTIKKLIKNAGILQDSEALKKVLDDRDAIIELAMRDITFKTNPVVLKKDELGIIFDRFQKEFL